ncbi:hypothetical protein FDT66_00915 [Polaribacter aestuariivivens]|uniref:Uncharacterized protein n=1 Tax=Polaribacter aestuariivivens TaxID=2304626 RepID=A0A5S3N9S6_9FLAO|nr:hypothetical protein [Polaribacter aestuariivivens]TMM32058.1 hypothetical protein FDT66_00915 [Polaribacter aestuariivivens]
MSTTKTQLTTGYIPIDSLTMTIIGNATADINFNFDAELSTITDFKNTLTNKKFIWTILIPDILIFVASFLIDVFTKSSVPVIKQVKSFEIPDTLLNDIFQIETTKIHIDGSISMTNNSNAPVTAKVFAETLTVEGNGQKKHIINPEKLFIGYINKNLQAKSATQKITLIKGAKVNSKVI